MDKRIQKKFVSMFTILVLLIAFNLTTFANVYDPIADTLQSDNTFEIQVYEGVERANPTPILCKVTYGYNSISKNFDFSVNLDAPNTPINKPKLTLAVDIKKSNSKNGTYNTITSRNFGQVGYLANSKLSIPAATGHYKIVCNINTVNSGIAINLTGKDTYWCINRTGHVWVWNYTDSLSKKTMSEPYTAYVKNQTSPRIPNLNNQYKTWYDSTYKTNLNLSNYDIHHIRPLAYGGDNTMANLINIDKSLHRSVTSWWQGY